ncbi:helix-turn-helix transcriptional regulator, partial [Flavobacterium sp.]|uniref:helix-turn-helix domain-containing protein n=1 Tax=Flavobacterium sp. TaxID=239 RepID=UPI0025BBC282
MTAKNIEAELYQNLPVSQFGERISRIIEMRGLSKAWIAEQLGISKQALNYLLKHSPKPKFIDELAELLEVSPEWLEYGVDTQAMEEEKKSSISKLYILSEHDILKEKLSKNEGNHIDFINKKIEDYLAFQLADNSNFPPFIKNSILIFDTKKKPTHTDYVLIIIEDKVHVRQFLVDGTDVCYQASN